MSHLGRLVDRSRPIDEVILTIRSSQTDEIARNALMQKFGLSEKQASSHPRHAFTPFNRAWNARKSKTNTKELLALIEDLKAILAEAKRVNVKIIKDELDDMKKKNTATLVVLKSQSIRPTLIMEDLIADEEMVYYLD